MLDRDHYYHFGLDLGLNRIKSRVNRSGVSVLFTKATNLVDTIHTKNGIPESLGLHGPDRV